MNHSTSVDTIRNYRTKISRSNHQRSIQTKTITTLQNLSQTHMDAALHFMELYLPHVCIILSDRAMEYMLKALYIKERNGMFPPQSLSLHDVIQLTSYKSVLDLDMVMFHYSIHFLASCNEPSFLQQIHAPHLQKLLGRVDDVLTQALKQDHASFIGTISLDFLKLTFKLLPKCVIE